jgi:hypothetical protein
LAADPCQRRRTAPARRTEAAALLTPHAPNASCTASSTSSTSRLDTW